MNEIQQQMFQNQLSEAANQGMAEHKFDDFDHAALVVLMLFVVAFIACSTLEIPERIVKSIRRMKGTER